MKHFKTGENPMNFPFLWQTLISKSESQPIYSCSTLKFMLWCLDDIYSQNKFFFLFFYTKILNILIFLKLSSIVISRRPEICCFQLFHIWDAGHEWVKDFWLSQSIKYPISPSSLKCFIMFIGYLRIVDYGFYFRGIILLTCAKKGTWDM